MKIKVISLATPNIIGYAKYSTIINDEYCKKHGYDFDCKTQAYKERPPAWSKIRFLIDAMNEDYDWLVWIDADAHFSNHDVKIESFIRGDNNFIFSEVNGLLNSGVFLVKCCLESQIMLDRVYSMDEYINHVWWENKAFIELWNTGELKQCASLCRELSDTLQTAKLDSFTIHLPGTSLHERTNYFKSVYNDYKKRHINSRVKNG